MVRLRWGIDAQSGMPWLCRHRSGKRPYVFPSPSKFASGANSENYVSNCHARANRLIIMLRTKRLYRRTGPIYLSSLKNAWNEIF